MIKEVKRNYLEINSLLDLKEGEKPTNDYSLNLIDPINFQLNKFFYKSIGKNLPTVKVKKNIIIAGFNILDLVLQTKLANSKGEIRRMIKNNGLRINNEVVTDETKIINQNNFDENNNLKVSHGKKQHIIIKII